MLFKSTLLLSLFATSFALPTPDASATHLVARAQIPASVNCDGASFSGDDIRAAIQQSRVQRAYPKDFGNKAGSGKVFGNIPDGTNLYEQPLMNPAWTGGEPGKYRVVVNKDWKYIGTMVHIGGVSNSFKQCVTTPVINPPNLPSRV